MYAKAKYLLQLKGSEPGWEMLRGYSQNWNKFERGQAVDGNADGWAM